MDTFEFGTFFQFGTFFEFGTFFNLGHFSINKSIELYLPFPVERQKIQGALQSEQQYDISDLKF